MPCLQKCIITVAKFCKKFVNYDNFCLDRTRNFGSKGNRISIFLS